MKKPTKVNNILNQLDGNQLTQLATNVVNLANSNLELNKEELKTEQTRMLSNERIAKHLSDLKKIEHQEYTKRQKIQSDSNKDELQFKLSINKENNKHEQIMNILSQVKNGHIPASELEKLINSINSSED